MSKRIIHRCLASAMLLASPMSILPLIASDVPDAIAAHGEILVAAVEAAGAQIYECKADMSGKLVWQFREPVATLFSDGETVGRHYAGPHWEMTDGSTVSARVSARAPGASDNDIPLLKLEVTSWRGTGQLAGATTIQRINTRGGVAEGACEVDGTLLSVPYTADYTFYRKTAVALPPAPVAPRPVVVRHVPVATPVLVSPPAVGVIVVRRDSRDWPRKKKKTGQPKSPPTQPTPPTAEPTTPPAPQPPTAEPTTPTSPPATPNKTVRDHRGPEKRSPIIYEEKARGIDIRDHRVKPEVRDHRGSSTPSKPSMAGGPKGFSCLPGNPRCQAQ
jgi:hypothetical protein